MNSLNFLSGVASDVAARLLGCILEREIEGQVVRLKIVETEAYDQTDAASHSYKGSTPRTEVMFGPPGHLYVYFTYGMHYCCNIVTGTVGEGSAVLIRAVEPLDGYEMLERRRGITGVAVTNGPAKLCQALSIDLSMNGHNLNHSPLRLLVQPALGPSEIMQTTRIGISRETERPWRFYLKDSAFVSKRTV